MAFWLVIKDFLHYRQTFFEVSQRKFYLVSADKRDFSKNNQSISHWERSRAHAFLVNLKCCLDVSLRPPVEHMFLVREAKIVETIANFDISDPEKVLMNVLAF